MVTTEDLSTEGATVNASFVTPRELQLEALTVLTKLFLAVLHKLLYHGYGYLEYQ